MRAIHPLDKCRGSIVVKIRPPHPHYFPDEPDDNAEAILHHPYADRSLDPQPPPQPQYYPPTPSHGYSQGHSQGPVDDNRPLRTERPAPYEPPLPDPPVRMASSRAAPRDMTQTPKRASPFRDPPSSPVQIFCDDSTGHMRGVGCRHPSFQYSLCTGKKKGLCVSS